MSYFEITCDAEGYFLVSARTPNLAGADFLSVAIIITPMFIEHLICTSPALLLNPLKALFNLHNCPVE